MSEAVYDYKCDMPDCIARRAMTVEEFRSLRWWRTSGGYVLCPLHSHRSHEQVVTAINKKFEEASLEGTVDAEDC